jgi:D-alanine-D-alanine ligase
VDRKIRVGIVFGGRSAEHEVSLQSAKNVIGAIDRSKYEPVLIGIDRSGKWFLDNASLPMLDSDDPRAIRLNSLEDAITIAPGDRHGELVSLDDGGKGDSIDVLFPVLHGPYGEDGSVQGLARLANLPCVGAGILGSAIGMDKDVAKRLLHAGGIAVAQFEVFHSVEQAHLKMEKAAERLGLPLFVKPANMGSSVGVSKVSSLDAMGRAIEEALEYDTKIVLEEAVVGREIECSVLGNNEPVASVPGEIVLHGGFYSYDAKYIDENGATLSIPAALEPDTVRRVQETATRAFEILECRGMARVDMFLREDGEVLVNEINTIPGFTKISMFPKLWEASGIPYAELIDRLIQLAIEDFEAASRLKTVR